MLKALLGAGLFGYSNLWNPARYVQKRNTRKNRISSRWTRAACSHGSESGNLFLHLIPYKRLPRQQITVRITQVIPVNGEIFRQASSHCTYPHTATASTLENIQPLSSNPRNILDVTGINTSPNRNSISHQVKNAKKSEPRSQ